MYERNLMFKCQNSKWLPTYKGTHQRGTYSAEYMLVTHGRKKERDACTFSSSSRIWACVSDKHVNYDFIVGGNEHCEV